MLFFVWLKLMLKKELVSRNISISFFTSLSPKNGFPRLKIPGISSYGWAAITWSLNLDVNKMAEYKSMSTHIYYWPTRRYKTIHQKVFRSSISGTCCQYFFSHNGARIQIDFCIAHVRTVTRDVTWWLHNAMWRFR